MAFMLVACRAFEAIPWRLKTTLREPVWEFTRANEIAKEIAEHI